MADDGTRLAFLDTGTGDPEPVVLLHSLGTDSSVWSAQLAAWSGAARVLAPDSRGHGASAWRPLRSVDDWVEDLDRVLAAAGVRRCRLVGLSMGGVQALAYTRRRPERVGRLVLADTFAELEPDAAVARVKHMTGRPAELGMAEYAAEYTATTLTGKAGPQAAEVVTTAITRMSAEAYAGSAAICFTARQASELPAISASTLVVWGELDAKTPKALSEQLASGIPAARMHVLPDAGHLSNLDNPEAFTDVVGGFLFADRATPSGP
ncbi:MAG TPA: alpha/beta fold hydrolase [Trebonia sp.]|nr:alpha/beta fold hydrolase [Trebonia sp.]